MKVGIHLERWPARATLRIAGKQFEHFDSVVLELEHDGHCGRGEALGIFYKNETALSLAQQLESVRERLERGINRATLPSLLPHGGARNAVDLALWDLEAKRSGRSIWQITGIQPRPLLTGNTISIADTPEEMAEQARSAGSFSILKIKLDAHQPIERVRAVRKARPDVTLHVDANQGWDFDLLRTVAPALADLGVVMIEQPLPRGRDESLEGYAPPLPLCADESCFSLDDLDSVSRRYQMINIKLDKAGGLTHALALARAARDRGLGLMIGNMGGTSLAMAPAFLLGCLADYCDVDGPLWLKSDRAYGLRYQGSAVSSFDARLWG